ncbi:MAG: hypothetical protein ACRDTC_06515 [Pseudonocardiaceae bacterium]
MTGTVLVTRAAGRIGETVCAGLAEQGWTIRGTDIVKLPESAQPDWAGDDVLILGGGEFCTREPLR